MDFALKQVFVLTIILGTILVIISENRNPVKTIAWCVVLAFMPVIGLLLYILFGMDNRHRRLIKEDDLSRLKRITVLPPHTILLGRPSALAPSIQYRASNLDWHLVSYMIFYMFH